MIAGESIGMIYTDENRFFFPNNEGFPLNLDFEKMNRSIKTISNHRVKCEEGIYLDIFDIDSKK